MGEGKVTPLATSTPLNRQSPNKYCIRDYVHHISPHATFGQHSPKGFFSHGPRAYAIEPILTCDTPTDNLNRQSPNIAHVITSTISPHTAHLVKVAPRVTSPHIAKVTTQFFFISFFIHKNRSTDIELKPLNRF